MNESERIKILRQSLNLKQGDFAKRISTTQGHISDIENKRKELSDRTLKLICLEFNVNAIWLRTGEGEMFNRTDDGILAQLEKAYNLDDLDRRFIEEFLNLSANGREVIKNYILAIVKDRLPVNEATDAEIVSFPQNVQEDEADYEDDLDYPYKAVMLGDICAGDGIEPIEDKEIIPAPVECDFALKISGDSMEPMYYDGQIIYLNETPVLENGEIGAIQVDTDIFPTVYLKKFYKEKNHIRLVSLNDAFEDKIIVTESIKVLGKVVR